MLFTSLIALVMSPAGGLPSVDEPAVFGVVVDAENRPVEGAEVLLSCGVIPDGSVLVLARVRSDADGRFRLNWPGRDAVRSAYGDFTVWAVRDGLGLALQGVPKSQKQRGEELRIKFAAGKTVQIKVVGPNDASVKGIRVSPFLLNDRSVVLYSSAYVPDELAERLAVESNDEGLVDLGEIPPRVEVWRVRVTIPTGYSQVFIPRGDESEPPPIRLGETAGRVTGRVLTLSGQPVADVPIEIWSPAYSGDLSFPVTLAGRQSVRTDAAGRFSIPAQLLSGRDYRVSVRADGVEPCYSANFELKAGEEYRVPDVVVRPLRTIEGRVLDRTGNAVAGARVIQSGDGPVRTHATTDAHGRFRLDGFRQGLVFLFVERQGFRFHGQPVESDATQVDVVLRQTDEPPVRSLRLLPSVLPPDQERKMAIDLINPHARRAMEKPNEPDSIRLLGALTEIEPNTVLEWLAKKPDVDPNLAGELLCEIVKNLASNDVDEAAAVAASIDDEGTRVQALIAAGSKLAHGDREKRIEWLAQAQTLAQAVTSPGERIDLLSRIAGRWHDLGKPDRAVELLRTARQILEANPKDPACEVGRWRVAEGLAPIDLDAALNLLKDANQKSLARDRPYLLVAIRLAEANPEQAERVLNLAGATLTGDSGALKAVLCHRMAGTDLPRARRIAASIDEQVWRVRALSLVAQAVAATQRAAARELIDQGFAVFAQMAEQEDSGTSQAVAALGVVEYVDPDRLEEFLWRAIALRPVLPDVRAADSTLSSDEGMARGLALYDRVLARHFVESALAQREASGLGWESPIALEALVLIDPRRAVERVEQLKDSSERPGRDPKKFLIARVARLLGLHGQARQRAIMDASGFIAEDAYDF